MNNVLLAYANLSSSTNMLPSQIAAHHQRANASTGSSSLDRIFRETGNGEDTAPENYYRRQHLEANSGERQSFANDQRHLQASALSPSTSPKTSFARRGSQYPNAYPRSKLWTSTLLWKKQVETTTGSKSNRRRIDFGRQHWRMTTTFWIWTKSWIKLIWKNVGKTLNLMSWTWLYDIELTYGICLSSIWMIGLSWTSC